jgi:hypothetical protein
MDAVWQETHATMHPRRRIVGVKVHRRSLLRQLAIISAMGTFLLLPMEALNLPSNVTLVDLWNLLALPVMWTHILRSHQKVHLPFLGAMWMILLASIISMLWARDASTAAIVVLKEIYVYVWFVTMAMLLTKVHAQDLTRLLSIWTAMILLHGLLIIGEFLSTDLWHAVSRFFGPFGQVGEMRPPGLFPNANGAAFFQLMGFVPLILCTRSIRLVVAIGIVVILSIVGTGSLGAAAGLLLGAVVAPLAMAFGGGRRGSLYKLLILLPMIGASLLGLYLVMASAAPDYEARLAYYFYNRAEHSAEERVGIWQSGWAALSSDAPLWGVGPGNVTDPISGKLPHNDLLAFTLERGVLGALGLLWLGAAVTHKAVRVFRNSVRFADSALPVVLLAAVMASLLESQFHQVFHERSMWLVLAVQEALLLRTNRGRGNHLTRHRR